MKKMIHKVFFIITAFFGGVGSLWLYFIVFCFIFPNACSIYPILSFNADGLGENSIAEFILSKQTQLRTNEIETLIQDKLNQMTFEALQGQKFQQVENLKRIGMNCKDDKIDCYYHGYITYYMSHRPPEEQNLKIDYFYSVIERDGKIETNFKMFKKNSSVKFK